MQHRQLERVAIAAADAAREHFVAGYERKKQVHTKADDSWVTDVDLRVEAQARRVILEAFPEHSISGEELGHSQADAPYSWFIDPIDGTVSFVHQVPTAAVILTACHQGAPVVAVIDLPVLDWRIVALAGEGAYLNGQRLTTPRGFAPERDIVCHGDRYTFDMAGYTAAFSALETRARHWRSYTDAFGHVLVAKGSAALMVDAAVEPWEGLAFELVAREAGGAARRYPDHGDATRAVLSVGRAEAVEWAADVLEASARR